MKRRGPPNIIGSRPYEIGARRWGKPPTEGEPMENMGARKVNGPQFVFTGDSPQAIIDAMMKQGLLIRGDSGWVHSKEVHKHGPLGIPTDGGPYRITVQWACMSCLDDLGVPTHQWVTAVALGSEWPPTVSPPD